MLRGQYNIFEREMRILKEQVNFIKRVPRSYLVVLPKNVKAKLFNYEPYLKISKDYESISLIPNEKFGFQR